MSNVLAVVSNYKRPDNLRPICDSPDRSSDRYDWPGVKDVWCWKENSHPPARWYPVAALSHLYDYVVLIDDDAMLAPGLVGRLLIMSANLNDDFANIGPMGRMFRYRRRGWRYSRGQVAGTPYDRTDMAVRGYWIHADSILDVVRFRNLLAQTESATPEMLKQDDIILNVGLQHYTKSPSYVAGGWYSKKFADNRGYAFSQLDPHFKQTRYDLIGLCHRLGWRSLAREGG
ncbi:MAG: hypothetical protein ACYTG0_25135 [Planctomycetota bacterium]|jgi:hypothetical protein